MVFVVALYQCFGFEAIYFASNFMSCLKTVNNTNIVEPRYQGCQSSDMC